MDVIPQGPIEPPELPREMWVKILQSENFWVVLKNLSREQIFQLRSMHKTWREEVDRFLENHKSFRPHTDNFNPTHLDFVNPVKEKDLGSKNIFLFAGSQSIQDYEIEMEGLRKNINPFVGRYLTIHINVARLPETQFVEFWGRFANFLQIWGKYIYYLTLGLATDPTRRLQQRIQKLVMVDLFHLFPSLRKLRMVGVEYDYNLNQAESDFQTTHHLETIESEHIGRPGSLHIMLLNNYKTTLGKVCMRVDSWRLVCNSEWPNLQELHVKGISSNLDLETSLCSPFLVFPRLSKLGLSISQNDEFACDHFVRILNQVAEKTKLCTLRLDKGFSQRQITLIENAENVQSVNCQIRTLEIDNNWVDANIPCYTFLCRLFLNIKNVHIFVRDIPDLDGDLNQSEIALRPHVDMERVVIPNEVIQLHPYMYDGNMQDSNVWELLPVLNVLSFQFTVYTRDGLGLGEPQQ